MIDANGKLVAPTFLPAPRPPVLLAVDAHTLTVRRYARNKKGRGFETTTCYIEPAEVVHQLGAYAATRMLEDFRLTGRVP